MNHIDIKSEECDSQIGNLKQRRRIVERVGNVVPDFWVKAWAQHSGCHSLQSFW